MDKTSWKRKEYDTWDEAFRGLAPAIRQQSVRVAAYTQALYVQACELSFGSGEAYRAYPERVKGKYAELAYKCGFYHQIGKALVPQEYQILQKDFTQEEVAVYRKYTSDGRRLAARLQEKSLRAKERRRGSLDTETPTDNIPWLMIRESCGQHMERYDGSGYPNGVSGGDISPIAQIVGLAKELDRLSAETRSEDPFDEAFAALEAQSGTAFAPALIEVLKRAKEKCREVYNQYIHYTLTIPQTIPLVEKRRERPLGLHFRPIVDGAQRTCAYEATSWFGGIVGRSGETEGAADVSELLKRTDLTAEVAFYLLYEATDALLRIKTCGLAVEGVVLNMLSGFYGAQSHLQRLNKLFEDQPVERSGLILTIPTALVASAGKSVSEIITRYLKNGIVLMLDDWSEETLPLARVRELGFTHLRLAPSCYGSADYEALLSGLPAMGIRAYAADVDSTQTLQWLAAHGVRHISGPIFGREETEDEIIRESLLRERENG